MGCDIHIVVERRFDSRWVGVYSASTPTFETREPDHGTISIGYDRQPRVIVRSYAFFARLAGVRGDGPDPNGVPDDASELARAELAVWEGDGHSHGHCSLEHFMETHDRATDVLRHAKRVLGDKADESDDDRKERWVGYAGDCIGEYRVIFWFDN